MLVDQWEKFYEEIWHKLILACIPNATKLKEKLEGNKEVTKPGINQLHNIRSKKTEASKWYLKFQCILHFYLSHALWHGLSFFLQPLKLLLCFFRPSIFCQGILNICYRALTKFCCLLLVTSLKILQAKI